MEENQVQTQNQGQGQGQYEIDLLQMLKDLLNRWYIIAISAILCGLIALTYTVCFITPKYTASIMMYIDNSSSNGLGQGLSYNDISTARSLVDTYVVILTSRSTLERVSEEASLDYTAEELKNMISISIKDETEIFSVNVTHQDPYLAARISNTIAKVFPEEINKIVMSSNAKIIDEATIPTTQSSPNYKKNSAIGLILGIVLSAAVVLVYEFFNDEIKSEEWVEKNFGNEIPLLAIIPDLNDKSTYMYGKYRKYGYYTSDKPNAQGGKQ